MNYRLSKLITIIENDESITISAHALPVKIVLSEPDRVEEFRALRLNGGTENIVSELEHTLHEQKVLIAAEEDEIAFLEEAIKEQEARSFTLTILPTHECITQNADNRLSQAHYDLLLTEVASALENGKKHIAVSWFGGEPLIEKESILYFNSRARDMTLKKGAEFHGSITTNGLLLDGETLQALYGSGITVYQIKHCTYADGTSSLSIKLDKIRCMLSTNLAFTLILRVNVTGAAFDFSFYDLFLPYREDERLSFLITAVGQWGNKMVDLRLLEGSEYAEDAERRHREYLRSIGLKLSGEEAKGILSDACYAAQQDTFVIFANGRIGKCAVAQDDEENDIGYLDIEKGKMIIDYNTEDLWSYNLLTPACYNCEKVATCCNRSCALIKRKNKYTTCCCERINN